MNKAKNIPYSWAEIEDDIQMAIIAQADILGTYGPNSLEVVDAYLGVSGITIGFQETQDEMDSIPLERHLIYGLCQRAYKYAYQLDGWEEFSEECWYEIPGLLNGFPRTDMHGEMSPFDPQLRSPIRTMLKTCFARAMLYGELCSGPFDLSIKDLSLLANMTIPAVRTSLSKEGFRLDGRDIGKRPDHGDRATLASDDAHIWLSRRRGFIPNRKIPEADHQSLQVQEVLTNTDLAFDKVMLRLMQITGVKQTTLVDVTGMSIEWVSALVKGDYVACDAEALCAIARVFDAKEANFTPLALRHLLSHSDHFGFLLKKTGENKSKPRIQ